MLAVLVFLTQAQLRAFIPEMLKYSTGRGKPGWGKESCKPMWWPDDIPWANVRSDVRTEEQKQRVSREENWTNPEPLGFGQPIIISRFYL